MCVCSQAKLGGLEVVIDVGEFDEQWQRVAGQQFSMQNTLFVPHDFAVSKSYYIFFYSDTTFELVSHSPCYEETAVEAKQMAFWQMAFWAACVSTSQLSYMQCMLYLCCHSR